MINIIIIIFNQEVKRKKIFKIHLKSERHFGAVYHLEISALVQEKFEFEK